jgi:DNA-binding NarL/FixJ family response regulator
MTHTLRVESGPSSLTQREIQVIQLVSNGLTDKEAAHRLGTSWQNVRNHLYATYRKLGAKNRTHAVVISLRAGLITLESE